MKKEIINIATLSKGRLKYQAEKVFKKNGLKIISNRQKRVSFKINNQYYYL